MKTSAILLTALLCASSAAAITQETAPSRDRQGGESSKREKVSAPEFVQKAGAAGLAELEMGNLGVRKATDADVQSFAKKMVADHTMGNKALASAARPQGLEVPAELDPVHKEMMSKFEGQTAGRDFDRAYMQQMVRDHQDVVDLYSDAASDTSLDPELRELAEKMLPTLQEHLQEAQKLAGKLAKR